VSARFRLVYLVPDPFVGARVPLGALLAGPPPRFVRAQPELGRARLPLARLALEVFPELESFDVLPEALGALLELGPVRELPDGAGERWLEALLSPPPDPEQPAPARSPQRATFGRRFFETWQVGDLVRATFRPDTDWDGRLAKLSPYGEVSHWVAGADSVLLMEPVVPRPQLAEDLRDLAKLFAAYRAALRGEEHTIRLVAYLLPGATERQREEVLSALVDAHEVIDTEDEAQRAELLQAIREQARTAQSPKQQEMFGGR
jgi:hypothetical protein